MTMIKAELIPDESLLTFVAVTGVGIEVNWHFSSLDLLRWKMYKLTDEHLEKLSKLKPGEFINTGEFLIFRTTPTEDSTD